MMENSRKEIWNTVEHRMNKVRVRVTNMKILRALGKRVFSSSLNMSC